MRPHSHSLLTEASEICEGRQSFIGQISSQHLPVLPKNTGLNPTCHFRCWEPICFMSVKWRCHHVPGQRAFRH